jgi:hypothetical protein
MSKPISIAKIDGKTPIIQEGSWGSRALGEYAWTMELYAEPGSYFIEWDIPKLEMTEHIGLTFQHKTLTDYDGIMSLPQPAIEFLRQQGFIVPAEFSDEEETLLETLKQARDFIAGFEDDETQEGIKPMLANLDREIRIRVAMDQKETA